MDRRLGGPLPRQLPNPTRAPLKAAEAFAPQGTCGISLGFPRLSPTSRQVPTRYSPVRHSRIATGVRLACVKHAASVRSEPGSNSQVEFPNLAPLQSPSRLRPKNQSLAKPRTIERVPSRTSILKSSRCTFETARLKQAAARASLPYTMSKSKKPRPEGGCYRPGAGRRAYTPHGLGCQ